MSAKKQIGYEEKRICAELRNISQLSKQGVQPFASLYGSQPSSQDHLLVLLLDGVTLGGLRRVLGIQLSVFCLESAAHRKKAEKELEAQFTCTLTEQLPR